jgi:multicomponent Na+:H+ antiporter subunit D
VSPGTLAPLLPVPVLVLLAGAALAPLAARLHRRLPAVVAVVAAVTATGLLLAFAPTVYGGRLLVDYLSGVLPVHGAALGIAFAADPFGLTYALVASGVGAVLAGYTLSELSGLGRRELGGYAALFLLLDGALVGSALTADVFNLFVWFEVAALASYALTGFFLERPVALEAAFKVLVLTTIAGFLVFVGTALLYSEHGQLNFGALHEALRHAAGPHHHLPAVDRIALALLVAGFATKAGLAPFHGWLPDAHTAAPGPVSALFSGLMVNLGLVAIGRLVLQVYGPGTGIPVLGVLTVLGLVSALGGALLALVQDDLKRLLAYDTVSQLGVVAVGLATATTTGTAGTVWHLLNHAVFKSLLFLCAGAIVHLAGVERLSQMGGLARRRPLIAAAFLVGAASVAGIPPLGGYVSVGLIHQGLLDSGQPVVLALLVLAQVVTVAALARAAYLAFFARRGEPYGELGRLRPGMATGFGVLAALSVAAGVLAGPLLPRIAAPAAGWLLDAAGYARAVLAGGGHLGAPAVPFDWADPLELALLGVSLAGGLLLAVAAVRRPFAGRVAALLRPLRAVQTGSVNDYAGYLTAGVLVVAAALLP